MVLSIIGFLFLLLLGAEALYHGLRFILAAPVLHMLGISPAQGYAIGGVLTTVGAAAIYFAFCLLPFTIRFTGA